MNKLVEDSIKIAEEKQKIFRKELHKEALHRILNYFNGYEDCLEEISNCFFSIKNTKWHLQYVGSGQFSLLDDKKTIYDRIYSMDSLGSSLKHLIEKYGI